mgnify:FL=1
MEDKKPVEKTVKKPVEKTVKKTDKKYEYSYYDSKKIENLTKDLNFGKVCSRNSVAKDETVIAFLLKNKLVKYECSNEGCEVKSEWNSKPIPLVVYCKNGNEMDLQVKNIKLMCPNCYAIEIGPNIQKKFIGLKNKCTGCSVNMNLKGKKNIGGYCEKCYRKRISLLSQHDIIVSIESSLNEVELTEEEKNNRIKELELSDKHLSQTIMNNLTYSNDFTDLTIKKKKNNNNNNNKEKPKKNTFHKFNEPTSSSSSIKAADLIDMNLPCDETIKDLTEEFGCNSWNMPDFNE